MLRDVKNSLVSNRITLITSRAQRLSAYLKLYWHSDKESVSFSVLLKCLIYGDYHFLT